jgi:hypothetical protein
MFLRFVEPLVGCLEWSRRRRLAREPDGGAELPLRLEEEDGELDIGIEPVQGEAAISHLAPAAAGRRDPERLPSAPRAGLEDIRLKTRAAGTGRSSGPTTRPRIVAPRSRAMSISWSGPSGFGSTAR